VPGSRNLRDLGGYRSALGDGTLRVEWGQLYRSGHFGELQPEGRIALARLGIETLVDFRMQRERERHPNQFASRHSPRVYEIPVDPGSSVDFQRALPRDRGSAEAMAEVMELMNRSLVRDHALAFAAMFRAIAASERGACVIHCVSGKDRTGIGAALLLSALGVDRATILEDFMLTNRVLDAAREVARAVDEYASDSSDRERAAIRLRPMVQVRASYLLAAFDEIEHTSGGIDAYLRDRIGLDATALGRLRERYLCNSVLPQPGA